MSADSRVFYLNHGPQNLCLAYLHVLLFRHLIVTSSAKTNVGIMLGQRRRRWAKIKQTLDQNLVSAGLFVTCFFILYYHDYSPPYSKSNVSSVYFKLLRPIHILADFSWYNSPVAGPHFFRKPVIRP